MELGGALERSHYERAKEEANLIAPAPKHQPIEGGIAGFMVASIVVAVFMGFANLDREAFGLPVALTGALGFAVPYLYLRHEHRKHGRAFARALEGLKRADRT